MAEQLDVELSFWAQHSRAVVTGGFLFIAFAGVIYFLQHSEERQVAKSQPFTMVKVLLPPPPPPQQMPQPKMIEQPKILQPEFKQEQQETNKPSSDRPLGLDAKGDSAGDAFNLVGNPGGGGLLGGGGGSRWGWYAGLVQDQIAAALRANARTRNARFNVEIAIWVDRSGHVLRARLNGSTGDVAIDRILRDEILPGLTLKEAPPQDMPMPIIMRNVAQRPS